MRSNGDGTTVAVVVALTASAASALLAVFARQAVASISSHTLVFAGFLAVTLCLALAVVDVYGKGTLSFAGSGLLAIGILMGPGPSMIAAVCTAALLYVRTIKIGAKLHRALFNAATFALSAGVSSEIYAHLGHSRHVVLALISSAFVATIYCAINLGLISFAMAAAEEQPPAAIFHERFRWMVPYYVVSGPLAYSYVMAFQKMGVTGLLAFALPPLMMMVSVRQYVNRTRESVEEVRSANTALEQTNADLQALFDVTAGLAARTYDRAALVEYATGALEGLTGCDVQIFADDTSGDIPIVASSKVLGSLELRGGETSEQWERLQVAVLPQLGTALESVNRIDEINKRHLATIAALSHSMEAKDNYTGGHTERVAELAVALARRLGCQGEELQALEVGALLHDIGKIGISESVLHKPGPLDESEWRIMRQHPLISERILSDIGLSPIVLDIARSSHERIDGNGYPHGLAGDEIPLAARIVLVADAFDALTSDRPYRERRTPQRALEEIRAHAGTQFCVRCVGALEEIYRDEPQLVGLNQLRVVGAA